MGRFSDSDDIWRARFSGAPERPAEAKGWRSWLLLDSERALALQGKKIEAIREIRKRLGADLWSAKFMVECALKQGQAAGFSEKEAALHLVRWERLDLSFTPPRWVTKTELAAGEAGR